jgi:hypothetical protein
MLTAYHPQTDGQMERINHMLEGYLRTFTSRQQDDWDNLLPSGEFHYNNSVHSSTQQTPFMVDTGRHPPMGFEPQQLQSTLELVNEFAEHMALGIEEAKVVLTKVKDEYTMYYNRRREPALVFTPGDKVWLDGSDIATNRHTLAHLLSKLVSAMAHTAFPSLTTSDAFTPSSPWSSCPLHLLIPSLADNLRHLQPQLLSMVRRSMRSRQY